MAVSVIKAFTDGSACVKGKCECEKLDCPKCNRFGGCGVYYLKDKKEYFISKGFSHTKTGRMEIMAVLFLIQSVPKKEKIELFIFSDSQYVVNALSLRWVYKWESLGWMCANPDLWQKVLSEIRSRPDLTINITHIKGHQKDLKNSLVYGNNVADLLADYKQFKTRDIDESF